MEQPGVSGYYGNSIVRMSGDGVAVINGDGEGKGLLHMMGLHSLSNSKLSAHKTDQVIFRKSIYHASMRKTRQDGER
jgi:hypothetical protein